MRRSASQILRNLERRIAHLENNTKTAIQDWEKKMYQDAKEKRNRTQVKLKKFVKEEMKTMAALFKSGFDKFRVRFDREGNFKALVEVNGLQYMLKTSTEKPNYPKNALRINYQISGPAVDQYNYQYDYDKKRNMFYDVAQWYSDRDGNEKIYFKSGYRSSRKRHAQDQANLIIGELEKISLQGKAEIALSGGKVSIFERVETRKLYEVCDAIQEEVIRCLQEGEGYIKDSTDDDEKYLELPVEDIAKVALESLQSMGLALNLSTKDMVDELYLINPKMDDYLGLDGFDLGQDEIDESLISEMSQDLNEGDDINYISYNDGGNPPIQVKDGYVLFPFFIHLNEGDY
tara:strand:+ start:1546 stop:2583 length:1038 start_codon:yes stop_codon:yes gene_type:complete